MEKAKDVAFWISIVPEVIGELIMDSLKVIDDNLYDWE